MKYECIHGKEFVRMKTLSLFMAAYSIFVVMSTSAFASDDPTVTPENGAVAADTNMTQDPSVSEDPAAADQEMNMTAQSADIGTLGYAKYKWYCWYEDEEGQLYKGWGWSKYKAKYTAMKKCEFAYDSLQYHNDGDDDDDGYYGQYCEYFKCIKKKVN
jgi:hypothetical protein